jgi:hypothetical protein
MDLNKTAQQFFNQSVIIFTYFFFFFFLWYLYLQHFPFFSLWGCVFGFSCQELGIVVSSIHTTLSIFSVGCQNLKTSIFYPFTRRVQIFLIGNCESISFKCTVPLGCFRTITKWKSNVSRYLLQKGTKLYVFLEPSLLLNSTYSVTPRACMDNVACSHF